MSKTMKTMEIESKRPITKLAEEESSLSSSLSPPSSPSLLGSNKPFSPKIEIIEWKKIVPLLQRVKKPGRYTGGEFGTAPKDPFQAEVRVLLTYPDIYELGMSNEGLKILYNFVNRKDSFLADRAYLPWDDFGYELQKAKIPLYSLEHFLSVRSFDMWGFNTCHELQYTNLCYALDLANIPILRKDRREDDPLIITGGTAVSNPFPLFEFMDAIFLGDGEEAIVEICEVICQGKRERKTRREILFNMESIEGIMIPELYQFTNTKEKGSYPVYTGPKVRKRNFKAINASFLDYIPVPNIEITQQRVVVEAARGCGQGCRFCHAGFWKRPVRNSDVQSLIHAAGGMLEKTGYDSVSLHSLSIADYPWLEELVVGIAQSYGPN